MHRHHHPAHLDRTTSVRPREERFRSRGAFRSRGLVSVVVSVLGAAAFTLGLSGITETAHAKTTTKTTGVKCGLANGKKATGAAINVGAIVGATGPADFSSASKGAAAFFACVNANGGINGRPVSYQVKDDGWDPVKASQFAKALVEDSKVVAMIGSTSFVECGANAEYYVKQNVAVIAGVGVPRECFHSPNISPTNQGPRLSGIGVAQYAVEQGAKSIACVANVIPNFGAWVCQGIEAYGKANGITVKTFLGKADASDAESVTLQAIGSNPDAIVEVDPGPVTGAYLKVGEQQGGKVKWYGATSTYDLSFPKSVGSYWNNKFHAEIELSPLDSTGPDNTTWRAVLDKYGKSSDPRDSFSQAGFLAAKIFTDTMLKLKPAAINRAAVTTALKAVKGYHTDLTCAPWYFGTATAHNANHSGRIVQMTGSGDTGFKTVKECFEIADPELDSIRAAEKSDPSLVK